MGQATETVMGRNYNVVAYGSSHDGQTGQFVGGTVDPVADGWWVGPSHLWHHGQSRQVVGAGDGVKG